MIIRIIFAFLLLVSFYPLSLHAQESPEAAYQKWVEASRAGDIEALLAVSSAAQVKEYHEEFNSPEKQEEIRKLMKAMAPITYKVKKNTANPRRQPRLAFFGCHRPGFFHFKRS